MTIAQIFYVLSAVCFLLLLIGVAVSKLDLQILGLLFLAAGHIAWPSIQNRG